MKRLLIFSFLLLITSCNKDEVFNESKDDIIITQWKKIIPVKQPVTPGDGLYDALGIGYNVTYEFANSNSVGFQVIDISSFQSVYPNRLITEFPNVQEYNEIYGENARSFSEKLTNSVNVSASIPLFKKTLKSSFASSTTATNKFDAKFIYGSYSLTILNKRLRLNYSTIQMLQNFLTPEFIEDLNTKQPYEIVRDYGTHVLTDIYTGGKMDILFQSETLNQNREYAARVEIKASMQDVFDLSVNNSADVTMIGQNYNRKLFYKTRGGNPAYGLQGTINLNQNNPVLNISQWQNSCTVDKSVLVDFGYNGLILIYELISDPIKKAQIKSYVDQYLIDNQTLLEYLPTQIYRYYNPTSGDHFYTRTSGTYETYGYEGVEFNAYTYRAPNTVPFYRYFNSTSGDHYYAKESGAPYGYISEGIEFYAYLTPVANTVPIRRHYNPTSGDHFYTRHNGNFQYYNYEFTPFYAY